MTIVDLPPPSEKSVGRAFRALPQTRTLSTRMPETKTAASSRYSRYFKRLLDVGLVVASAPITLPLVAVCAALVARDGHSPLFRQRRIGRDGRVFSILKLRTMVPDAEALLADHISTDPDARAEWEAYQKLTSDPRITPLGALLRRTSLDELPQLWNVLTGDMALVGPRPMMEEQQPLYPGTAYYHLRPGLTGLWQISARNQSTFADRSHFDADYWNRVSLIEDLRILIKTVAVVLRQTGT